MFRNGKLSLSKWLSSYKQIEDYSYFNAGDILPSISSLFFTGFMYLSALFRRIGLSEKSTSIKDSEVKKKQNLM